MKKVLVIAYYFPPLGLSGVQRTLKFVKYLPMFGWQPTVLTVDDVGYFAKDETLLQEIDQNKISIVRTPSKDINHFLRKRNIVKTPSQWKQKLFRKISDTIFIPDNKIGWKKYALKAASELLEKEKFDSIFATAPPQTDFLVGMELKKKYHIPLILDYRDSWLDYPFKFFPTPIHKYLHYRLERKVLRTADSIIVTTRRVKETILNRHKFLTHKDINILTQGFDPADVSLSNKEKLPTTKKMRFTYSGTFYENVTPEYFFRALAIVFKNRPALREKIEACFIGAINEEYQKMAKKYGVDGAVNFVGYLPHHECINYLYASDVLWMVMNDDIRSPGKIYEYIAVGKKILGCVSKGVIRSTIEEANGICTEPRDIWQIADTIIKLYEEYEQKKLVGASPEIIHKYNRVNITDELAKILTHHMIVE